MKEYQDTVLKQAVKQLDSQASVEPKSRRGGAREGAGRKREYTESKRLKCKLAHANLANAFINILDKFSKAIERNRNEVYAVRLDGAEPETKGSGVRTWVEYDAIRSDFPLVFDHSSDKRLFAVAFVMEDPEDVRVDAVTDEKVTLRWQRADEVARVMTRYGSLLARRRNLTAEESEIYGKVPRESAPLAIAEWVAEYLNY